MKVTVHVNSVDFIIYENENSQLRNSLISKRDDFINKPDLLTRRSHEQELTPENGFVLACVQIPRAPLGKIGEAKKKKRLARVNQGRRGLYTGEINA